jgi:hypothetical protein
MPKLTTSGLEEKKENNIFPFERENRNKDSFLRNSYVRLCVYRYVCQCVGECIFMCEICVHVCICVCACLYVWRCGCVSVSVYEIKAENKG